MYLLGHTTYMLYTIYHMYTVFTTLDVVTVVLIFYHNLFILYTLILDIY